MVNRNRPVGVPPRFVALPIIWFKPAHVALALPDQKRFSNLSLYSNLAFCSLRSLYNNKVLSNYLSISDWTSHIPTSPDFPGHPHGNSLQLKMHFALSWPTWTFHSLKEIEQPFLEVSRTHLQHPWRCDWGGRWAGAPGGSAGSPSEGPWWRGCHPPCWAVGRSSHAGTSPWAHARSSPLQTAGRAQPARSEGEGGGTHGGGMERIWQMYPQPVKLFKDNMLRCLTGSWKVYWIPFHICSKSRQQTTVLIL